MYRIIPFLLLFACCKLQGQVYENPDITRVLVDPETNLVHIYFTGTDHPDVSHYLISQWLITGNNPVASGVPIGSSRTGHTMANSYSIELDIPEVNNEPVGFSVGAYNTNNEVLLESYPPDSTIHLTAVYDSCEATVWLQWNDYNAWRGDILEYEIRGENTTGTYNLLQRLQEGTNEVTITGLQANNDYHFYVIVRKTRLVPDAYVTSNGVNFDTPHSFYPEFIHADYGTVSESNAPYLRFAVDSRSELDTFHLLRSEDPLDQYNLIKILNPIDNRIEYTDNEVDASVQPYYYKIVAINYCQEPIMTSENIAGTIHLEAQLDGFIVNLQWTEYYSWNTGVDRFDIERMFPGEEFEPVSSTNMLSFSDESLETSINQGESSEVCYRIIAYENPGDPNSSETAASTSNIVCINLPINIQFNYNAFVPGLENYAYFGPSIDFLPVEARFKIYNRWGNLVFETHDIYNLQWDGRVQGKDYAPEGVYRYQLEYKNESGEQSVIHGSVTVVRQ